MRAQRALLSAPRFELEQGQKGYPAALLRCSNSPERLYVLGDRSVLEEGIAIVGARKATPYGMSCAERFARQAARAGVVVISGGARGCDAAAHKGALAEGGRTLAFLGGGCEHIYPAEHAKLFQDIIAGGGALVSEHPWDTPPRPWMFRQRNRLIASLARATLIVEAGLPSGTFSTADEALAASREVLVVPGAISAPSSRGANRLLYQGASPIVDEESFADALLSLFGCLRQEEAPLCCSSAESHRSQGGKDDELLAALRAEPLGMDALLGIAERCCGAEDARSWLAMRLAEAEAAGIVCRYPSGCWAELR